MLSFNTIHFINICSSDLICSPLTGGHVLRARRSSSGRIPAEKRCFNDIFSLACQSEKKKKKKVFFIIYCKKNDISGCWNIVFCNAVQVWSNRAAQRSVSWLQTSMRKRRWWRTSACRTSISMKYGWHKWQIAVLLIMTEHEFWFSFNSVKE